MSVDPQVNETKPTEQNTSSEAIGYAASQEILSISWHWTFQYPLGNSSKLLPISSHIIKSITSHTQIM